MNLRSLIALLLSILVIILGALLPTIVANRQDAAAENHMLFQNVEGIELEFVQSGLTMSDTLSMLASRRETVEIPVELTALKQNKLENTVAATAIRYQQSGLLFDEIKNYKLTYSKSLLVYGRDGQSNIFWEVRYSSPDGSSEFHMMIDDRTGTLCSITYSHAEAHYQPQDMEQLISSFVKLYLSGLGEEFYDYSPDYILNSMETATETPEKDSYVSAVLSLENELYGQTELTFLVNPSGFRTYF